MGRLSVRYIPPVTSSCEQHRTVPKLGFGRDGIRAHLKHELKRFLRVPLGSPTIIRHSTTGTSISLCSEPLKARYLLALRGEVGARGEIGVHITHGRHLSHGDLHHGGGGGGGGGGSGRERARRRSGWWSPAHPHSRPTPSTLPSRKHTALPPTNTRLQQTPAPSARGPGSWGFAPAALGRAAGTEPSGQLLPQRTRCRGFHAAWPSTRAARLTCLPGGRRPSVERRDERGVRLSQRGTTHTPVQCQ